jgi:hypothetical protein
MSGIKQSGCPQVVNIALPLANTEYSYLLNRDVKKFLLQDRGTNDIKLAFKEGESGTNYFTLKGASVYFEDGICGPIWLYMQSPSTDSVVEIIYFMAKD